MGLEFCGLPRVCRVVAFTAGFGRAEGLAILGRLGVALFLVRFAVELSRNWGSVVVGCGGVMAALRGEPVGCAIQVEGHGVVVVFAVVVVCAEAFELGGGGFSCGPGGDVV